MGQELHTWGNRRKVVWSSLFTFIQQYVNKVKFMNSVVSFLPDYFVGKSLLICWHITLICTECAESKIVQSLIFGILRC